MIPMATSISASDALYEVADATSKKEYRSLAQQIEHWAEPGRAIEAARGTSSQILDILAGDLRARERVMLKLGLVSQESLYLIPTALARMTKVRFPELKKSSSARKPRCLCRR